MSPVRSRQIPHAQGGKRRRRRVDDVLAVPRTRKALEAIRGFALWRVAQQLLQMDLAELDVFLASAGAVLLVACRTAVTLGRDACAGEAVARTGNGPSLLNTLSEVALLASTQMLLSPVTSNSNQTLGQHMLRILYVAAAAGCVKRTLSGKR